MLALLLSLTSPVLAGESAWLDDFEAAKQAALKEGKIILANFSGSDWCGWCIKLDKEVLSKKEFADFAAEKLVLFNADFPDDRELPEKTTEQNKALAVKYNVKGFPTVLLLDAKGGEIARTGYRAGGAAAYIEHLKTLTGPDK